MLGFAGDLGTGGACDALAKAHPDVDIVVNNMGIFEPKPFLEIPDEDWMRFFEVNVLSGVRLARLYLPRMLKKTGAHHLHLERERGADPRRDDPLRHYQDRAARGLEASPSRWRTGVP